MPAETRPSFTKERMIDNASVPKNSFGHTLWGGQGGQPPGETQENLQITLDERGERKVKMDVFDSPVMREYIAKQRTNGSITEESDGSYMVRSAPASEATAPPQSPQTPKRTPLGDPESLEDFDKYVQAFNRGDDLSLSEEEEEEGAQIIFSHTPLEQPILTSSGNTALTSGQYHPENFHCDSGCGSELPPKAKFCWWCGKQQQKKFCASCGFSFQRNEKFCPDCGSAR